MTGRDVVLRQAHSRKERTRRIRFAEANWSKDFQRPWLRTIGWLILCLPALLILLAYDTRDRDAFAGGPPATWRETLRVAWREALRELPSPFTGKVTTQDAMALRLTGRLFTALALVSAAIALLSHLPPWGIVASTTLAGVLLLNPRTNWANHVIVAMEGRAAYGQITARVQACLDTAAQHSQRIIVVAHSQGGFIAHELLVGARRPRQVTELIGLGSGLKPISLLRVFHKPRVLVGIWIGITGAVTMTTTLYTHIDISPDALPIQFLRWGLGGVAVLAVTPWRAEAVVAAMPRPTWGNLAPWDGFDVTWSIGIPVTIVFYAIALLAGRRLLRDQDVNIDIPNASRTDWTEISTPHDIVGRLLYPGLPGQVTEISTTLGGNPLADHTNYFAPFSPVPLYIMERVLFVAHIGHRSIPFAPGAIADLQVLGERRRRLRAAVSFGVLGFFVLTQVVTGTTVRTALLQALPTGAFMILTGSALLYFFETRHQRRALNTPLELLNDRARATRAARRLHRVTAIVWLPLLVAATVLWIVTAATRVVYGTDQPISTMTALTCVAALISAVAHVAGYRAPFVIPGIMVIALTGGVLVAYVSVLSQYGLPVSYLLLLPGCLAGLGAHLLVLFAWGWGLRQTR